MNALKDILVDAARYRWLRENIVRFVDETIIDDMSPVCVDNEIDKHLAGDDD